MKAETYIVEIETLKTDNMNYEYSYRHNVVFDSFDEAKNYAENLKRRAEADAERCSHEYDDDDDEYDEFLDTEEITRIVIWSHTEDDTYEYKKWSAWER